MIDQLKPLLGKLALFSQKRMGFKRPPKLFLRNDSQNSQQALGKTAFYDPNDQSVTLFIHGRHPKDILRSFAHELVHHCQNERGDLSPDKITASGANYAQECPHMRKMEKEAYLQGNMCFRDWEDEYKLTIQESKFLKENKTMTTKITKEFLKETIRKILAEEEPVQTAIASLEDAPELQGTDAELDRGQLKKRFLNTVIAALKSGSAEEIAQAEEMFAQIKAGMAATPSSAVATGQLEEEVTEEAIEEGGCGSHKKGDGPCPACGQMHEEVELEENEELEEAVPTVDRGELDGDDVVDGPGDMSVKDGRLVKLKEGSKIQTPEQENTLYEQRFAPKNNRLFEKLVKEWTK